MAAPVRLNGTARAGTSGETAGILPAGRPAVKRLRPALLFVLALAVAYALGFSVLALRFHDTFLTYGEDLGFTDQIVWNTLHGRPWRFSFYEQAEFTLDIDPRALRHPDSLLAYHVEPLLLAAVPLYLVWSSPKALLVSQALVMAAGVLAAYWLARLRLGSEIASAAFALAYALLPQFQSGLLDFHTVMLAAPLLLFAAAFLASGRWPSFTVCALLAMLAREETGISVALLSLYGAVAWGRRSGLAVAALGFAWSLVCAGLILPVYTGGTVSPFLTRYALLDLSAADGAAVLATLPRSALEALARPQALDALTLTMRSYGFLPLIAPAAALVAAPALALNLLSTSKWMVGGHAHYPAIAGALLFIASVEGARVLMQHRQVRGWPAALHRGIVPAWVVAWALWAQVYGGRTPIGGSWQWPEPGPRERLLHEVLERIPPGTSVSAQTTLAPHLSQRERIYLFPTLRDAEYVVLDQRASTYPVKPDEYHAAVARALASGCFIRLFDRDGVLLLGRAGLYASSVSSERNCAARSARLSGSE